MGTPRQRWVAAVALTALLSSPLGGLSAQTTQPGMPGRDGSRSGAGQEVTTETPITHVIVLIGENRSFDHTFATYEPTAGQTVSNLLSKGIITKDGLPGPNFVQARQFDVRTPLPAHYFIRVGPGDKTPYAPFLPTPELGGAPHSPVSPAQLEANPTGVQPPFDPTISEA